MFILLNPKAAGGMGRERWKKIEPELISKIGSLTVSVEVNNILDFYGRGGRHFVAAGGDGTVNLLATHLINNLTGEQLRDVTLGAIGIGSSNDYHKSCAPSTCIAGFPCKINPQMANLRDILMIKCPTATHYALLNVGMGVTAQANHEFNQGNGLIGILKKLSSSLAIVAAALQTILTYRSKNYILSLGHERLEVQLTNLNILKSPHIAGCFCYPYHFAASNGQAAIYLCQNASRLSLINTLIELTQRRFTLSEKKKKMHLASNFFLNIRSEQSFPIEFDGEVCLSNEATISINKNMLNCC